MPFTNRRDAGQQLAHALARYKNAKLVVLALPRGGVPVAAEIATTLNAPLDLILVRKIGAPFQPELAMGAVVDGPAPITVRNEDVVAACGVSDKDFDKIRVDELAEIDRRRKKYLGDRPHPEIAGHTAIIVDDGIATGATIRAALRAVRQRKPARLILAVPVAPTETLRSLRTEADDIVCLEAYADFGAIGYYYRDFRQVSDAEVIDLLARHPLP
jgi:predicted phosphoribosyltransferase